MMLGVVACAWWVVAVPLADDIAVKPSRSDSSGSAWVKTLGALDKPGERTLETLKRYDLAARYRQDASQALAKLEQFARRSPEPELVFALAELSYIEGKRSESRRLIDRRHRGSAIDHYLDAVAYAYDYLFDPALASGRTPADPRYRMAMDLYNGSLDRLIRAAQAKGAKGRIQPGATIPLKINDHELSIRVEMGESPWLPTDVDELILASEYEVTGLDSKSRVPGLGVPLIAVRRAKERVGDRSEQERFLPPLVAFPLTAMLRPTSKLREAGEDVAAVRDCSLLLVDPVRSPTHGDPPNELALETDLTTPLAYMWSQTDLNKYRWKGLLRPGEAADRAGLMLIRPFEPHKVPVVMVHGLMSSPLAWIPMFNELLRDPKIQQNYQFLLYVYPTGMPIPIAASGLRDSLLDARKTFGDDDNRAAFDRMVLLGHSMGGLLSHAMAARSGNQLWALNSALPFDEIVGPADVLNEVRHYTFFEPVPCVRRVIFLATPHRGSDLAKSVVGKVGAGLIADVDRYTELLNKLIRDNPNAFDRRRFRRLPTSVEMLEPPGKEPNVLSALLAMESSPDVAFHSIIGYNRAGPLELTTDGVVPYRSSHYEPARSERMVGSDHGVQKDPEAILEVRRILYEHLDPAANRPPAVASGAEARGPVR